MATAPAWSSARTRQCNESANSLAWSARPEVAALGGLPHLRPGVLARLDKISQPVWQPPAVGGGSHVWPTGCGRIRRLHRNDDAREGGNYPRPAAHRALNSLRGVSARQCLRTYQRLTPPANLGLLALSSRRVLPGRAARGSVVPRKMACLLARGAFHGDCGARPSTRAQGRGSSVAAPSNWSKRETEEDWGRDRRGNKKPRLPRGRERG